MNIFIPVIFLSVLFVFLLASPLSASDWRPLGTRNGNMISIDRQSLKPTSNGVVQYLMKLTLCDDSKMEILQSRTEDGLSNEGWNKLSYGISLNEISCQDRKTRGEFLSFYDTDDNQLYYQQISGDWSFIVPGTGPDLIQEAVCKKYMRQLSRKNPCEAKTPVRYLKSDDRF